jgi:cobalt-zinc-cadmium efflux system protein
MSAQAHLHRHGVGPDPTGADRRALTIALGLILALMAAEVAVGIAASSLALLSDAGHMLTDAAALGLSLVALRLARRPAGGTLTYGWRRVEILSAQANGITLLVLAGLIVVEAVRRLVTPPDVAGVAVLLTALAGVVVNLLAVAALRRADRRSLNVEGSFQHILTDLYAFLATALAAALVITAGWNRADAVASIVVAALMLRSGWGLLRATGRVLLEAAPEGVDPEEIGRALASSPGVVEVHDLHVWEVSSGFPALSAHVTVEAGSDCHALRRQLEAVLHDRFELDHTTLQVDHAPRRVVPVPVPGSGAAGGDGGGAPASG